MSNNIENHSIGESLAVLLSNTYGGRSRLKSPKYFISITGSTSLSNTIIDETQVMLYLSRAKKTLNGCFNVKGNEALELLLHNLPEPEQILFIKKLVKENIISNEKFFNGNY